MREAIQRGVAIDLARRQACGRKICPVWRIRPGVRLKADGVAQLVECGAGKVLTGLARRIEPGLEAVALGAPADIEAFVKTL